MKYLSWVLCIGLLSLLGCGGGPRGEGKIYRIARDPSWFPLDFEGQERRVLAFSDELLAAIGQEEDFGLALYPVTWEMIPVVLKSGQVDGVLTALPPIPQYRDQYDFSDIYIYTGPVLVVSKQSEATSLKDMHNKLIGVLGGSSAMLLVAKVPDIVIRDYMNMGLALEALQRGQIDGVVMSALPAYAYMRNFYAGKLKIVTAPLTDAGLRLIVEKGKHKNLIEMFNEGLETMLENGTYERLDKKWQLNLSEGPSAFVDEQGKHAALLQLPQTAIR